MFRRENGSITGSIRVFRRIQIWITIISKEKLALKISFIKKSVIKIIARNRGRTDHKTIEKSRKSGIPWSVERKNIFLTRKKFAFWGRKWRIFTWICHPNLETLAWLSYQKIAQGIFWIVVYRKLAPISSVKYDWPKSELVVFVYLINNEWRHSWRW